MRDLYPVRDQNDLSYTHSGIFYGPLLLIFTDLSTQITVGDYLYDFLLIMNFDLNLTIQFLTTETFFNNFFIHSNRWRNLQSKKYTHSDTFGW